MIDVWAWLDSLDTGQVILYVFLCFTPVFCALLGIYAAWFWLLDRLSQPRGDR